MIEQITAQGAQVTLHPVDVRQGDAGWRLPIRRGAKGAVHTHASLLRQHVLTLSYAAVKNPLRMFVLSEGDLTPFAALCSTPLPRTSGG